MYGRSTPFCKKSSAFLAVNGVGRVRLHRMQNIKTRFLFVLGAAIVIAILLVKVIWFGSPLSGQKTHDFGIIEVERPTSMVEHTFVLTNQSGEDLVLVDVIPDCGCATTQAYQSVIPKGEDLILPVQFKLRQSQLRRSTIRLVFENGKVEIISLQAEGRMKQPLRISPVRIVLTPEGGEVFATLGMERFDDTRPPKPEFKLPEGMRLKSEKWKQKSKNKSWEKIPANWSMRLELKTDLQLPEDSQFVIVVNGNELIVPLSSKAIPPEEVPITRTPVH